MTANRTLYAASAPTSGAWIVGDVCVNSAPAIGSPKQWVCVSAGTPGTWVVYGTIGLATSVYIDPVNGSDANNGTLVSPVLTLTKALAMGASTVFIRKNGTLRFSSAIAISSVDGLSLIGYAKSGDTQNYAQVWGSENHPAADFTAVTDTYTNLFFLSVAANPDSVFEVASGVSTRMWFNDKGPTTPASAAPDIASANGQAGAFFYGSGPNGTGLYIHPWGGVITGKSYEVPVSTNGLSFANCAGISLRDIDIGYVRNNVLSTIETVIATENCRFGKNGNLNGGGDAVACLASTTWIDHGSLFEDAGNDGFGQSGANSIARLYGSKANINRGDGISKDGANSDILMHGIYSNANGKNGFVSISSGKTRIDGGDLDDNGAQDILVTLADASIVTLDIIGVAAKRTQLNAGASGSITAHIDDFSGVLDCAGAGASITVIGFNADDAALQTGGNHAMTVTSGTMTVYGFKVTNFVFGFMVLGGTLSLYNGHILRSSGAAIYQEGGTLNLDAAKPVNQYGNAAVSSGTPGVSAPNQALLLNFAAI